MSGSDLTSYTHDELVALPTAEFVAVIKNTSDKDVKQVMSGPGREGVITSVFEKMPEFFRGERAGQLAATTHWTVTNDAGPADEWTVRIADGACTTARGHEGDPNASLVMGPLEFLKLISRSGNPVMMFMTGKLKVKGDVSLAANIGNLFDVPKA